MTARLRLRLGPTGLGWVELDGEDISAAVAGIDLAARVGAVTEATLRLPAVELDADADVRLHLPEATRELLVEHGWTPPPAGCTCLVAAPPVLEQDPDCPAHGRCGATTTRKDAA